VSQVLLEWIGLSAGAMAGHVAVVTGAGRGIGREVARLFASLGAKVALAEISESGHGAARAIREAGGVALCVRADVSREADVDGLAKTIRREFGPATILINSAIFSPVAPVVDMAPETWDRVIAVNLRGAFLTCRAFLPDMLAREAGTIINMTSAQAMPFAAAYAASKQALAAFSRSLAVEVGGRGVRVIAFGPGIVDTPGLRDALPALARYSPMDVDGALRAAISPEMAAAAMAYLVTRLADDYHGEEVDVYAVMDRAGVTQSGELATAPPSAPPFASRDPVAREAARKALAFAEELRAIAAETTAEFGRLPVFARPMAAHGFRSQAGQSVAEWVRALDALGQSLRAMTAGGGPGAASDLAGKWPGLEALLTHLGGYYRAAPKQVARFTRDEETLRQVTEIAARRESVVRSLIEACRKALEAQ